ncbi:unnamed protein product [Microthlaspi erraticum]|uniref:Uncharacterized protein n=1 Tax=Microthlaspi erraticum TaxID=1685480 RepID=A0A6D2L306_9BRAS|nr:unnamed protein product [Microthlaspi erraticum]
MSRDGRIHKFGCVSRGSGEDLRCCGLARSGFCGLVTFVLGFEVESSLVGRVVTSVAFSGDFWSCVGRRKCASVDAKISKSDPLSLARNGFRKKRNQLEDNSIEPEQAQVTRSMECS